jgi:hypothetical protein
MRSNQVWMRFEFWNNLNWVRPTRQTLSLSLHPFLSSSPSHTGCLRRSRVAITADRVLIMSPDRVLDPTPLWSTRQTSLWWVPCVRLISFEFVQASPLSPSHWAAGTNVNHYKTLTIVEICCASLHPPPRRCQTTLVSLTDPLLSRRSPNSMVVCYTASAGKPPPAATAGMGRPIQFCCWAGPTLQGHGLDSTQHC